MPLADFIHLRVHTAYSLSAGAIKIKELVGLCKANTMPAVAITDSGNLFGALEFSTACAEAGIQPIIGCEIALITHEVSEGQRAPRDPNGSCCWCRTRPATAICWRSSAGPFSTASGTPSRPCRLAELAARSDGLLCLTGGAEGPLGRLIAEGQAEGANILLVALKAAFPGRLYIELTRHGLPEEARCRGGAHRSRLRPRSAAGRDQRRAISPTATSTRRMTRCCASRRARSLRIPTATG